MRRNMEVVIGDDAPVLNLFRTLTAVFEEQPFDNDLV